MAAEFGSGGLASVEPFEIRIPDDALVDLQTRLTRTRFIENDFGADWRYGVPLSFAHALRDHWLARFDWRSLEVRINRYPQIRTEIDGLLIHAVHRRSQREDALPLVLLHGWPGSFLDFLDVIAPLSDPPAGEVSFHVVTPSLPGYAFSTTKPGITPQRVAALMVALMDRLGYRRFLVQGGNWGSLIATEMARQYPERVIGIHLSSVSGSPPPDKDAIPLTAEEQSWISDPSQVPHFAILSQTPFTPAHALNDSPLGLATWIGEKFHQWSDNRGQGTLTLDHMIATAALYWFTGCIGTSGQLYYEMVRDPPAERFVTTPTAVAIFPKSVSRIPRAWAERHYNIVQWTAFDRGGHFPAMEVPELFVEDVRRFAKYVAA